MRFKSTLCFLFITVISFGQETKPNYTFTSIDYTIGKTAAANFNFPEVKPLQGFILNFGTTHFDDDASWKKQLNYPKTGFSLSFADLGNCENMGYAISAMPFLELGLFKKHTDRINLRIGFGASYFNKKFDEQINVYNKAISTDFTWSFRSMLFYDFAKYDKFNFKLGLGYYHNSNGHVRLPNQGLNSFLVSLSSEYKSFIEKEILPTSEAFEEKNDYFFTTRVGVGQRVLSLQDNQKKEVYAFSAAIGKTYHKTFQFGVGVYYRFYEDYYDYIQNDGVLVQEMYPEFREKPVWNASNIGLFVTSEMLLSHIGVELQLGVNVYKPFYKVDWKINEGNYENGAYQLGELTSYYKLKHTISSRLGLKYYLISTEKLPQNNFYLGAFINANLGQADFSELSLGYVYHFKKG